jgi:hypothetical protein
MPFISGCAQPMSTELFMGVAPQVIEFRFGETLKVDI